MALQGKLEQLALLDLLQVIAFSKRTGCLQVTCPLGKGAIIFEKGTILHAYSPSTIDFLRRFEADPGSERDRTLLVGQIETALRELTRLQEGSFHFQLSRKAPSEIDGVRIPAAGVLGDTDYQKLLLSLAKDADDEPSAPTLGPAPRPEPLPELPPLPPEPTEQSPPEHPEAPQSASIPAVVLVDDEPMVTTIVGKEIAQSGYNVLTAAGPSEGLSTVRSLVDSGKKVLVITDLRMPTTTGRSFLGGFELVHNLRQNAIGAPVLLMTEKLTPKVRAWAKRLAIQRVAFKPALSKLDLDQYQTDLRSFATLVRNQLGELVTADIEPEQESAEPAERSGSLLGFLTSMTKRLMEPGNLGDISRIVLHVASKYLERGILFLLKEHNACGLGGFGLADTRKANIRTAQKISVDIHQVESFADVAHSRSPHRLRDNLDVLDRSIFAVIGRGRSQECVLFPLFNNQQVLAILYGDNAVSGKPLGRLQGLELFLAQAGLALENYSLQRKLSIFESNLSLERQQVEPES